MDVIEERVAGIDISKDDIKVCLRLPATGKGPGRLGGFSHQVRTFPSTYTKGGVMIAVCVACPV